MIVIKIDKTVIKETEFIAIGVVILSCLLQSLFLVISKWNYTILLGNVLSATAVVTNFFFMGLTVQKALGKDEKQAKTILKLSQTYRNIFILVVIVIGIVIPVFSPWTVIIPIFFPRIIIALRSVIDKNKN